MNIKNLTLPLNQADAANLKLGEIVTVSGLIFTGRSRFHIRAIENDTYPELDYQNINCFFHVGPVMKKNEDRWGVVSIEPTSSMAKQKQFEVKMPDHLPLPLT